MRNDIVQTEVLSFRETPYGITDMLKHMEKVGRIAYRSEDKITEDSASLFVERMKSREHLSVLEHSNICLWYTYSSERQSPWNILRERLCYHPYIVDFRDMNTYICYIGGSYRAWLESTNTHRGAKFKGILSKYPQLFNDIRIDNQLQGSIITNRIPSSIKRFTATIQCDRGISHEIVRHRVFSFLQESTRYVNYSNKTPSYIGYSGDSTTLELREQAFTDDLVNYNYLLELGESPQLARDVLPNMLTTKLAMTGTVEHYKHFIKLRRGKDAHPRIQYIAKRLEQELEGRNLL